MKKETKIFTYVIGLLLCTLMLAALPIAGEEGLYDNVLRFHVLANSDSEEDQALKLCVRDRILEVYGDRLADCTDRDAAASLVSTLQDEIIETALDCVKENGYDYGVRVTLTREDYPRREYEGVTLPSGEYLSLRILIGEGKGQNWWCVLFPPMCVANAIGGEASEQESVPVFLSSSQYRLISGGGKYTLRFRALELLESIFG